MSAGETHKAIEAIFRIERARLIAALARVTRDVGVAEVTEMAGKTILAAILATSCWD